MELGEKEGRASGEGYNVYNIGGNHLEMNTNEDVLVKRIDDLTIKEKIVFIKIDVEKMEDSVIRGGMKLIKEIKPYIMLEAFEDKFLEIKKRLCEIGYTCEKLDSSGNWLFAPENENV